MMNDSLKNQLSKAIREKKIKIKYPKDYKKWKEKFDYFYGVTKDVQQTLDIIYGPGGSADNYKGSLYNNSNFNIKHIQNKPTKRVNKPAKSSSVFNYLKHKHNGKPKGE